MSLSGDRLGVVADAVVVVVVGEDDREGAVEHGGGVAAWFGGVLGQLRSLIGRHESERADAVRYASGGQVFAEGPGAGQGHRGQGAVAIPVLPGGRVDQVESGGAQQELAQQPGLVLTAGEQVVEAAQVGLGDRGDRGRTGIPFTDEAIDRLEPRLSASSLTLLASPGETGDNCYNAGICRCRPAKVRDAAIGDPAVHEEAARGHRRTLRRGFRGRSGAHRLVSQSAVCERRSVCC